jgi:hypothetical protein
MSLPNVPTVGEFVPGFETSGWFGIASPKNTPVEVIDKLNKEINAGASPMRRGSPDHRAPGRISLTDQRGCHGGRCR